jgi:hypothetical protein
LADQQTCGKGLAEHSLLPARFGDLVAAVAENLEAHMPALDLDDDDSKREHEVYGRLVERHRALAEGLRAVGEEMAAQRDLPMGRHDEQAMSSPRVREAFERFVDAERGLLELLEQRMELDRQMLERMRAAGGS